MVAIGKFDDGAVLISDSRASSGSLRNDSLQKILPIGKVRVFCYSGSVSIANEVLRRLKILNRQKREYQYLDGIIKKLPGLLRTTFKSSSSAEKQGGLSVVVGGKLLSGEIKFWVLHQPDFSAKPIDSHCVIGSGSVVKSYLDREIGSVRKLPNLKARADSLMVGLSSELSRHGVDSVGGMFQIVLISKTGVQPLNYGYIDLDPEGAPSSAYMEMQNGQWVQSDLSKGKKVTVVPPSTLLTQRLIDDRILDYVPPSVSKKQPKWHLNYFMTSTGVKIGPGNLEFHQPMVSIGAHKFPVTCSLLASIGFWGSAGEEKLTLILEENGERHVIGGLPFKIQFFPEDIDIQIRLKLVVDKPGPVFLEARVRDKLLGRRAMYFGKVDGKKPKDGEEKRNIIGRIRKQLHEGLIKQVDTVVENGKPELVYFFLCQDYKSGNNIERFEKQFWVCYWKKYPLPLACYIASAFRLATGRHDIKIDLVDATDHSSSRITTASLESKSSCLITPVHGRVIIQVPKPGYYFVNLYIDKILAGISVLIAETDKPKFSYSLFPAIEKEVSSGQLYLLVKRSYQK